MLIMLPIILFVGFSFTFIWYIFWAIGIYQIAKNRGYKNAWLAFIPIANSYAFGGITDNINFCYGKKSSFRVWLLVLKLISSLAGIIVGIPVIPALINMANYGSDFFYNAAVTNTLLLVSMLSSILSLVSLATAILSYICLYKIYNDYSPNNSTMFLIFTILFNLSPFFIFAIRNKPSASLYFAQNKQPTYQPPFNPMGQPPQQQYQPPQPQQYQPPQNPEQ